MNENFVKDLEEMKKKSRALLLGLELVQNSDEKYQYNISPEKIEHLCQSTANNLKIIEMTYKNLHDGQESQLRPQRARQCVIDSGIDSSLVDDVEVLGAAGGTEKMGIEETGGLEDDSMETDLSKDKN